MALGLRSGFENLIRKNPILHPLKWNLNVKKKDYGRSVFRERGSCRQASGSITLTSKKHNNRLKDPPYLNLNWLYSTMKTSTRTSLISHPYSRAKLQRACFVRSCGRGLIAGASDKLLVGKLEFWEFEQVKEPQFMGRKGYIALKIRQGCKEFSFVSLVGYGILM